MVMICQCRGITDKELESAFLAAKARNLATGAGESIAVANTIPDLGDFNCGGCRRLFERAAQNYNETGDIGILKRAREAEAVLPQSGLCSTAASRQYAAAGIPNLRKPAINDIAAE